MSASTEVRPLVPAGLYIYTDLAHEAGDPYIRYAVTRRRDNRYLGQVRRELGTTNWTCGVAGLPGWLPDRHHRRDWAADVLDAATMLDDWCACGLAVGRHDRATRAACRAWARLFWATADPDSGLPFDIEARVHQAAYHVRPREPRYDLSAAVTHARWWAAPAAPDATPARLAPVLLVQPDTTPTHRVYVFWPDGCDSGAPAVEHYIGVNSAQQYSWPRPATLGHVRDIYLARGYKTTYDWRT